MTDFFNFVTSIQEKKELDPVKDKALDKKFKNRKDKDIDNDGDVDSSDEYLHKRRKTIDKAIEKDKKKEKGVSEATTKELKDLNRGDDVMVNGKMGMFYGMKGSKVEVNFPGEGRKMVPAGDVEIMDLVMDDLEKDDDDPCWEGYVQVGTKMKNGKEVPKCVPMEEAKKQIKEDLNERVNSSSEEAIEIISKTISMQPSVVKSALKDADLDPVAVVTALKGKKTIKTKQLADMIMGHTFGGSIDKKDLKPIKNAADKAFDSMKEGLSENYDYPDYGPTGAAEMAMTQLHFIQYAAEEVIECLKAGTEMPEWYQNKIAKVEGDMEGIHSYMEGKKRKMEMCGPMDMGMDDYDYDMDDEPEMDDDMDGAMMSMGMYEEASKKTEKELSNLMTKALDGKKPKAGFTSDIADNGDFVVRDGSGRVVGRIEKGDFKNPMKEETLNEKFSVYKPMSASPGKSVSNKAMVKSFKTKDDMYKFLAKGSNSLDWKETGVEGLKSGKYRMNMVRGKDGKPAREFMKEETLNEKLSATDDISDWIKDFKDSDAPQFKGKSDEERKDMAIAAYYDARDEAGYKTPQQSKD